jgi:hypothetical protein
LETEAKDGNEEGKTKDYTVPLSFWVSAIVATQRKSDITGTDPSQNYHSLYSGNDAFFHPNVPDKILSFHVRDSGYSIVGVALSFGDHAPIHRPSHLVIKNRRICTKHERSYFLPLMPSEVIPGGQLDIVFPKEIEADIIIQHAVIFIMKTSDIHKFITIRPADSSWITNPRDLLDFSDDIATESDKETSAVCQCVMAMAPSAADPIDPELFAELVRIMYHSPEASNLARGAVVRIVAVKPELVRNWAEVLKQMIVENAVPDELWHFVWRDFSCFDRDIRADLQDLLWGHVASASSVSSVLSAFTQD